jgi:transcriptional antiterminator Rof (Rho-off)
LNKAALLKMGLAPEFTKTERRKMQEEVAALSPSGQTYFLEEDHIRIFSQKENAEMICTETLNLVKELVL